MKSSISKGSVSFFLTCLLYVGAVFTVSVSFGQPGSYSYDLSGNLAAKTAGSITAPQILAQPQPQIVEPGNLASFSIAIADTTGVTYQWHFNGNPIVGATRDALVITNVSAANEGQYSVVVSNLVGSVTSSAAPLYLDADGDGLPDSWELAYFGNLSHTATGDFDRDGISNLEEFLDGTSPTNNASLRPRLTLFSDGGGAVMATPFKTSYDLNETVTLTATAYPPNTFHGWSGDLTTQTSPATFTMTANKRVMGRFLSASLPTGVVAWWRAENNPQDWIGTNQGALVNGVTFATGKVGQAFLLNGTNQSIEIADSSSLRPPSITLEAWVMFNSTTGARHVFAKPLGAGFLDSFGIWLQNGLLTATIANNSGFAPILTASFSPALGFWHHVAYTFDDATKAQALYIDGVRVAAGNADRSIGYDAQPVLLGRDIENGNADYFLDGAIDEATIYNRALTQAEIASIYKVDGAGKSVSAPVFTAGPLLPDGVTATSYSQQLTSTLGATPLSYSVSAGTLPAGLSMSSAGLVSGVPTIGGTSVFAVRVTDSERQFSEQVFNLRILAPVVPAGLVAWWRAENEAQDAVGANHGVLRNGATFASGKVSQAFSLDGVNDSIDIPDAPALRPASLTLEAWVMFDPSTGIRHVFAKPLGSGFLDSYGVWLNSGILTAGVADNTGFGPLLTVEFSPVSGRWYHLAYTFDDTSKQQALFIDGAQVASGIANKSIAYDNQPVLLGRDTENGSPNYFLPGRIDESALYNRALTPTEVASLYNAGPAGKATSSPYINTYSALGDGFLGQPYAQTITTLRATVPVTYTIVDGALPNGVFLNASGVLSGTPTQAGSFSFTVRATDATSLFAQQRFTVQVFAPVVPAAGIVGWWRAENNALDSIGTNNGALINGASFAIGKAGQAYALNGANQSIEIPDAPSLRPVSVSLEAWVSFNDASGIRMIMAKALGSGFFNSYALYFHDGKLRGAVGDFASAAVEISSPFTPVLGQWYHVALTFDDSTKQQTLYLSGAQIASEAVNISIGYDTHPVLIGRDDENGSPAYFFPGRIDEAAIYNRSLSAAEIATISDAGPAGRTLGGAYFSNAPALPEAIAFQTYSQTLTILRGSGATTFSVIRGSLPNGLTLAPNGFLGGTPTVGGSFDFTIRATGSANASVDQAFTLQVLPKVAPPAGIVAWWRAENNALDFIGTNHGTLTNGATFGMGKVAQAFSFDGVNDHVIIQDAASLRPASITTEAWVNFSSASGVQHILAKPVGDADGDSYAMWLAGGNLNAFVCDSAGAGVPVIVPFTPTVGRWYHITFTFDNAKKEQRLYIDGQPVGANISNRSIGYDMHPVLLGGDIAYGALASVLSGRLDEAAIYDRALSGSEIAALYAAGSAGKNSTGPYINTSSPLPDAVTGISYSQPVVSGHGTPPVSFSVVEGSLPGTIAVTPAGVLSGTPTAPGDFNFVLRVTDSNGFFGDQSFTLHVSTRFRVPDGIVSWWRAENNALDAIGTNNGTLVNGATFTSGKAAQAFSFDGVHDYVNVPDMPSLHPLSLSLEAWVLFNETPTGIRSILAKPLGPGFLDSYSIWWEFGFLRAAIGDTAGNGGVLSSSFSPLLNHWYHVAFTFDNPSKQQVLYLDAVTVASSAATKSPTYDSQPFLLGSDIENGALNYFFSGKIDEAAIYNRALTAPEINSIYSAGAAGKQVAIIDAPRLGIRLRADYTVLVSWPSSSTIFTLQENTTLESAYWVTVTNAINSVGGENQVFIEPSSQTRFYRLKN